MPNTDLSRATWRKSSYSGGNNGQCVEVALTTDAADVRDTKDREGGTLTFSSERWATFLAGLKAGQY